MTRIGMNVEKLGPSCTAGENVKWCSCYGKQDDSSSKSETQTDIPPSSSTSGCLHKRSESRDLNGHLHPRIHSSIVHISQASGTIQVSTHSEWINRMWHIHTKECYSAFKKNRSLPSPVWLGCPVHQNLWV